MKINRIKELKQIKFVDKSGYIPELSNDGGAYSYTETYNRVDADTFELVFGTSADMDYCPVCGSFEQHDNGDGSYSCGDFLLISEDELIEIVDKFEETETLYTKTKYM